MAEKEKPTKPRPKSSPKLTDAERHTRFVQMAHEVEASTDEDDFEKALSSVLKSSGVLDAV